MKYFLSLMLVILMGCSLNAEPVKIQVEWTAPGDDGAVGQAYQYDLRYMQVDDSSLFNWDSAIVVNFALLPPPSVSGIKDSVVLDLVFDFNTNYCFAIKTADEAFNWSEISNRAIILTPQDNLSPNPTTVILKIGQ